MDGCLALARDHGNQVFAKIGQQKMAVLLSLCKLNSISLFLAFGTFYYSTIKHVETPSAIYIHKQSVKKHWPRQTAVFTLGVIVIIQTDCMHY